MDKQIEKLANIIKDFRQGELPVRLDEAHVDRWVSQFSESKRLTVLTETTHILSEWYFDIEKVAAFLHEVYKQVCTIYTSLDDVLFVDCQKEGKSQHFLINMLNDLVLSDQRVNCILPKHHIIYIDDGLYSGSHITKDIKAILQSNAYKEMTSIDVFVMVGYTDGMAYVESELEPLCREKGICFKIYRWKELSNEKTIQCSDNMEEYYTQQDALWPLSSTKSNKIKCDIETIRGDKMHYGSREYHRKYKSRIFSSEKARITIEEEFLEHDMSVLSDDSIRKGLYPLGFSAFPSLGFGSFCANALNISNTCPIVLWWGNIQKTGNVLDNWYPLLPRRINSTEAFI